MEKPRSYIHIKKTKAFDEFGVLVIGRTVVPMYIILVSTLILSILIAIAGGIVAGNTGGESWGLLAFSGVPFGLLVLGLLIYGLYSMVVMFVSHIKKANRIERGLQEDKRY